MNGISAIFDWINMEQEAIVWKGIAESMKSIPASYQEGRSRVLRFGWDYSTPKNLGPAPDWIPPLPEADSWTINEYPPGQVITPHIDSIKFGDEIRILSLGAPTSMKFISPSGRVVFQTMWPRSLIKFSGEVRTRWKHTTLPSNDGSRYSIVYRTLRT